MTASDLLRYRDTIAQLLVGHSKPYPSYPIFMYLYNYVLEIKPCGFESRIRDMEAEGYNRSDFLVNV